jgi:hypothetical protein
MSYFDYTFSESPPFIIQENKDRPHNWNITDIKTIYGIIELEKSKMECSRINNFLDIPDIDSVKYSSDGRLLKANVYLTSPFNITPKVDVAILPNPILVSPSSDAAAIVKITAPSYEAIGTIPLTIKSLIEFPQNVTIIGQNTTVNNVSDTKITSVKDFTVSLLPSYGLHEYLAKFVEGYIVPLNSVWTFFIGVAAVLSPQIIKFVRRFFSN